jgi:hypothetical protein
VNVRAISGLLQDQRSKTAIRCRLVDRGSAP